ncbi:hypothetical protein [Furfurilactobacillus entadae]|uniref:hypothetical protein n=1 Tax=Furfurilactobacillus entadae TaxID=2922307 RepID=UPI0035E5CA30
MNVTTKYARNRRMYLDGNFRINTNGLPELSLINFDIVNNRMDTTAAELSNFQFQLLKGIIRFAEKINVYKIDYFATDSDSQQKGAYVSLKQKAEICKTLGFEEFTHDLDRVQKHFVKKILN